jgi:hypothetical protein
VGLVEIAGNEHGERLVHHFRNRVAEDAFRGFVDKKNKALLVDGDDGIGSGLREKTEKLDGLWEPFDGIDLSRRLPFP